MMRKIIVLLVALTLALGSCVHADDVVFKGVTDVEMGSVASSNARVTVKVEVENKTGSQITIKTAALRLTKTNSRDMLAEVMLTEPAKLTKRSTSEVDLPFNIYLRGGVLKGLALANELRKGQNDILVSGELKVKKGMISKKLKIKEMPVREFLKMVGMSDLGEFQIKK